MPGELFRKIVMCANPVQLTVVKWYELIDCSHEPRLVSAFFKRRSVSPSSSQIKSLAFLSAVLPVISSFALQHDNGAAAARRL